MIVASLLLILIAVVLLVVGVLGDYNALIVCSIVATMLAAIVLIIGVRQSAASPEPDADDDEVGEPVRIGEPIRTGEPIRIEEPAGRGSIPSQGAADRRSRAQAGTAPSRLGQTTGEPDEDPPDEPAIQTVSPSAAARVAMLTSDVLVVDGRPRYHVPDCDHLRGRVSEPLPVSEAVELGFTPCALCEPDSALLAEARRV